MIRLEENKGIPRSMIVLMAVLAGLTVANLYYNQPLLEIMARDLGTTVLQANLITVVTQVGYALGLFFIIPMADLYSSRKIVIASMVVAAVSALSISVAASVAVVWAASLLLGVCSVVPQIFIPIAGQFSEPQNKARNMGYVLSGLLTGILAARVVSGVVGRWIGWRGMFVVAAVIMAVCCVVAVRLLPTMKRNFSGRLSGLYLSIFKIIKSHGRICAYSLRGGFAFGSMLAIWSCLAFHLAQAPFYAGADVVGLLGLCGIAGAMAASGMGKWVPRLGADRMSVMGAVGQIAGWAIALLWGDSYVGLSVAIIVIDLGLQSQQLSNQSGCIQEIPEASNRANTIFMTTYFIGGSLGTFLAGLGWHSAQWSGVCLVGAAFALGSLAISTARLLTTKQH